MVRLTLLLSAAVAALLVAVPAAPAVVPEPETLVRVELDLAASNGYEAHLKLRRRGSPPCGLLARAMKPPMPPRPKSQKKGCGSTSDAWG